MNTTDYPIQILTLHVPGTMDNQRNNAMSDCSQTNLSLGTVRSLFYNMAGAKHNWATTFSELTHNSINTFYKAITFYELKTTFEKEDGSF